MTTYLLRRLLLAVPTLVGVSLVAFVLVAWAPGDHRFFANVRNNLKSWDENKGSVEFTYSYPLWGGLRLYLQYFNGYGDGLIYYNEHTNRFGLGIALNDVL